jgi:hypothetical protein
MYPGALLIPRPWATRLTSPNHGVCVVGGHEQGYYRRGSAYLGMLKFDMGLKDFRRVAKLRPRDLDAQKKLRTCETEVQKLRFQAAISSSADEGPPVSESVDPASYCTFLLSVSRSPHLSLFFASCIPSTYNHRQGAAVGSMGSILRVARKCRRDTIESIRRGHGFFPRT